MAGLLDGLDSDITRFGLGLLAGAGSNANFGQNLYTAVGAVDENRQRKAATKRAQQQEEYQAFQMQQAMAQAEAQKMAQADKAKERSIFAQNFQQAIPASADGMGPTRAMSFDHNNAAMQLGQAGMGEQAMELMSRYAPKPADYKVVGGSLVQIGNDGVKSVFTAPDEQKDNPFVALLKSAGIDPASPEGKKLLAQRVVKEATHQSPVSVSYGAPVAGVAPSGKPVFFQPGKNGGAPAIVPGVAPAGGGAKLTEDQAKSQGWLAQAEAAYANMMNAKKDEPGAESPGGADVMQKIPLIGNAAANSARSSARQRYIQGAGAFGEAALRAATGAGMNVYEAEQKIAQFTPSFMDSQETIKQKERDMQVFLKTLRPRATGKVDGATPADDSDPLNIRGGR